MHELFWTHKEFRWRFLFSFVCVTLAFHFLRAFFDTSDLRQMIVYAFFFGLCCRAAIIATDGNFTYKMYCQERQNEILRYRNEHEAMMQYDPNL